MSEKAYFYLLILSNFLCQGIMARLSDDDTSRSPDFLVRNKRVINHESDGNLLPKFKDIKYIVNIKGNARNHCVGAILSHFTVITAAFCFHDAELHFYTVLSGSAYTYMSKIHTVVSKVEHYGNPPILRLDGIALIKVDPVFTYGMNTGPIGLHVEPVLPGTMALISGWGCNHPTAPPMNNNRLRSITLPIMNHRDCATTYDSYFAIRNKHICTYDERKLCGTSDIGTPLVIDNLLVGIHIFKGTSSTRRNPDVFLDVQLSEYSGWIRENIITH